ncbi:unnamed protein product [Paramecium pentaurelia]|uniref:Protein kinase domain-containing protein n=1 Tax=Paramecium pentaurelia TaxID=43138 RepID=A0A8S1WGS2_9CILI|nr:unnamed protein product [Paramecium pentaurelia]
MINKKSSTKQATRMVTQANDQQEVVTQNQQASKYTLNQIVGNGTFGMVYLATNNQTNEKVAIKKVFQDKRYKNREHLIIQELNNPCVVKLKEAFFTQGDKGDDVYLNLVMDYIPDALSKVIRYYKKAKQLFPVVLLKIYSYQMFRALAYLEGVGICHRDIKPQNILVDPNSHILKICDFGSAKKLQKGEPNVAYICSRYYRAPELIFGATEYSTAIDMWSIGCVIAEMTIGDPLFPGESAIDQLVEIIKILGTPTLEQVKLMNPMHKEFKFPQIKSHPWNKVFQKFKPDPLFVDLISKIMLYPPKERLRPLEALSHPFFNEIRDEKFGIPNVQLPNFFDFSKEELQIQPEISFKLTPQWYSQKRI